MILAVAVLAQRLAAGTLKVQAGGVHEHPREQIAPMCEQPLLPPRPSRTVARTACGRPAPSPAAPRPATPSPDRDDADRAPRRRRWRSPRASDRRRGRSRSEPLTNNRCSTVRNTARSSANLCPRLPARSATTARQPISSHSRSNTSAGPIRRTAILIAASLLAALSTMASAAKRAPERTSRSSWPLACNVKPPERGDHLLAHLIAVAAALDDLQIGAPGRGLAAEIHGDGSACWCAHRVAIRPKNKNRSRKWHYTFAKTHLASNKINDLSHARPLEL